MNAFEFTLVSFEILFQELASIVTTSPLTTVLTILVLISWPVLTIANHHGLLSLGDDRATA